MWKSSFLVTIKKEEKVKVVTEALLENSSIADAVNTLKETM